MDKTSSMYLYVKLNRDANCCLPVESKDCINSPSYKLRNMSAKSGAQLVPIGMPIICRKTSPAKPRKCGLPEFKHLDDVLVFGVKSVPSQSMLLRVPNLDMCFCGYRFENEGAPNNTTQFVFSVYREV